MVSTSAKARLCRLLRNIDQAGRDVSLDDLCLEDRRAVYWLMVGFERTRRAGRSGLCLKPSAASRRFIRIFDRLFEEIRERGYSLRDTPKQDDVETASKQDEASASQEAGSRAETVDAVDDAPASQKAPAREETVDPAKEAAPSPSPDPPVETGPEEPETKDGDEKAAQDEIPWKVMLATNPIEQAPGIRHPELILTDGRQKPDTIEFVPKYLEEGRKMVPRVYGIRKLTPPHYKERLKDYGPIMLRRFKGPSTVRATLINSCAKALRDRLIRKADEFGNAGHKYWPTGGESGVNSSFGVRWVLEQCGIKGVPAPEWTVGWNDGTFIKWQEPPPPGWELIPLYEVDAVGIFTED